MIALTALGLLGLNAAMAPFLGVGAVEVAQRMVAGLAAASVFLRAARRPAERRAWALLGAGLSLLTVGAFLPPAPPEAAETAGVALVLGFYASVFLGLRLLGGRVPGQGVVSAASVVSMLGLAAVWAWGTAVLAGDPAGAASGDRNLALAYAFADFGLLLLALIGLAVRGWGRDHRFVALAAAFALLLLAHGLAAASWQEGSLATEPGSPGPLGPLALLVLGAAPWLRRTPRPTEGLQGSKVPVFLTAFAVLSANLILVWDHFDPLTVGAVLLGSATLLAAALHLIQVRNAHTKLEGLHSASSKAALDCILTVDASGRLVEWNPACEATFGYKREAAIGRDFSSIVGPPCLRDSFRRDMRRMIAGDASLLDRRMETTGWHADGKELPVELAVTRVPGKPTLFTAYIRDISVRRKREEQNARFAAIVDSSAEAMCAMDLERRVTAWNRAAARLFGYSSREVLGKPDVADRLVPAERAREARRLFDDVRAGRSVLLETQRRRRGGELLDVKLRAYPIKDSAGRVTGASLLMEDITDREWREARRVKEARLRSWREALGRAIANEELVFHAQPVVSLDTGEAHHDELLARMRRNGELLGPDEFLPPLEECGAIRHVDRWAVEAGARIAVERPVSINLSAMSLGAEDLIDYIGSRLESYRIPPENLTFEITETVAAANVPAAGKLVSALRALGCGVSLDDFGTGFGSFTYLKHLPISELKIDIDFIRSLRASATDRRVVRAILAVASTFSIRTVAEGVEDEETCEILRQMGVDCAQGFLFGRPAPLAA